MRPEQGVIWERGATGAVERVEARVVEVAGDRVRIEVVGVGAARARFWVPARNLRPEPGWRALWRAVAGRPWFAEPRPATAGDR